MAEQKKFFGLKEDKATKFILKNLPDMRNKTVLDFGCGHGKNIKDIEKRKAKKVYGIDPSWVMIEEAKKFLGKEKDLFVEDIQKTHFPSKFFDVVASRYALHYLPAFKKAYQEIARILKKGGTLIFVVDHPLRDFSLKKKKKYWQKEIVEMRLYENYVPIRFPTHTLGEYFSEEFFKYFRLDGFEEGVSAEAQMGKTLPDYLAVKATRK